MNLKSYFNLNPKYPTLVWYEDDTVGKHPDNIISPDSKKPKLNSKSKPNYPKDNPVIKKSVMEEEEKFCFKPKKSV